MGGDNGGTNRIVPLTSFPLLHTTRVPTGLFDETLGGGFVRGSVYLLSGWPGAGKSTLCVQVLKQSEQLQRGTYVCVEEHPAAITKRAERLGISLEHVDAMVDVDRETLLESVTPLLDTNDLILIDSISAIYGKALEDAVDFVSALVRAAQGKACVILCVVHVNKDGETAGLEALQHAPDCNLIMTVKEDRRTIEALKNRNGAAFIKTVFLMTAQGLIRAAEQAPSPNDEFRPAGKSRNRHRNG